VFCIELSEDSLSLMLSSIVHGIMHSGFWYMVDEIHIAFVYDTNDPSQAAMKVKLEREDTSPRGNRGIGYHINLLKRGVIYKFGTPTKT
jgi:hypothetical protein